MGVSFLDLALVHGKSVDFHLFDMAGSIGAVVMIVDPTASCYVKRDLDEARLLPECEGGKRNKHVLNGGSYGGDYFWQAGSFCSALFAEFGGYCLFYWCCRSWFVAEDCSAVLELCFGSWAWHCVPLLLSEYG